MQIQTAQTLDDVVAIVTASKGKNTFHLRGEKGIGKTSICQQIAENLNMKLVLMDCASLDIADLGIPTPNHEIRATEFYPNSIWGFHLDEPLFIVLDEYTKAPVNVQCMLHPLLTKPMRIGDMPIHPDSIVVSTGNLKSEGVGDKMKGHTANRLVDIEVKKPDSTIFCNWGSENGIHPTVLAWATREPIIFQSYRDDPDGQNPYISNPKRPETDKCVTPRSLHYASHQVWDYDNGKINSSQLLATLEGAIGKSGAHQLQTFVKLANDLPLPQDIIDNPESTPVPDLAPAICLTVMSALHWVDDKVKADAWFKYMERMPSENQAMFCKIAFRDDGKESKSKIAKLLATSKSFQEWANKNKHLF
jgi:hypothetical protein